MHVETSIEVYTLQWVFHQLLMMELYFDSLNSVSLNNESTWYYNILMLRNADYKFGLLLSLPPSYSYIHVGAGYEGCERFHDRFQSDRCWPSDTF